MKRIRVGHGYDVHRLTEGRALVLGGVYVPYSKGLLGHSDADVLTHAVMDALLGAAALGDIGKHFPDSDETYRGADSLLLLQKTKELVRAQGYEVGNLDVTVIAEAPKLASFIPLMRSRLAKVLETGEENVSIKATTEEGLGFSGRGEGIACHAVCLIFQK